MLNGLFADSLVLRGCELTTLFMLMKSAGHAMSLRVSFDEEKVKGWVD